MDDFTTDRLSIIEAQLRDTVLSNNYRDTQAVLQRLVDLDSNIPTLPRRKSREQGFMPGTPEYEQLMVCLARWAEQDALQVRLRELMEERAEI